MGRKRKSRGGEAVDSRRQALNEPGAKYAVEETFDDSEDDFFAGKDKILLQEGPVKKRQRRQAEEEEYLQPSDDEVLRHPGDFSEDEQSDESGDNADNDYDWGTSRADYYDADVIETEADALQEEQEARRLQQKQVQAMTEADFGIDELQWTGEAIDNTRGEVFSEKLPDAAMRDDMSVRERITILNSRYPEFEPLANDFAELQGIYDDLKLAADASQQLDQTPSVPRLKLRALSAYLGAIAMYFTLLTEVGAEEGQMSAKPAADLREHPVMDTLLKCRTTWERVRSLVVPDTVTPVVPEASVPSPVKPIDVVLGQTFASSREEKPKKMKQPEKSQEPQPRKKSRNARGNELEELLKATKQNNGSDFGDEQPLTAEEAAEKARKKKSLRFYTAQLAQKSHKRGAASREAGGDDDIPRKERLRDRQQRLQIEAERRGRELPDATEKLNDDPVSSDDANEYYDMITAEASKKKALKKARAEAAAEGMQLYAQEEIGPDGKRGITYAISKNKGLMPKRKKEVRNPRVKKRKKFDEKQKKLSSMRSVWKGGEGKGGYRGELTGIKTNVVKSTKL